MANFHVSVFVRRPEDVAALIRDHGLDLLPHRLPRGEAGEEIEVRGIASTEQIAGLQDAGYRVQRHESVATGQKQRLAEVGRGNRYAARLNRLRGRGGGD